MTTFTLANVDMICAAIKLRVSVERVKVPREWGVGETHYMIRCDDYHRVMAQMHRDSLEKFGIVSRLRVTGDGEGWENQALITPCEGVTFEEQLAMAFDHPEGWHAACAGQSYASRACKVRDWKGGAVYHQRGGLDI